MHRDQDNHNQHACAGQPAAAQALGELVEALVIATALDIAEREGATVSPETKLQELGFDSVKYVELSGELSEIYRIDLQPTVFFQVHTLSAIARYLIEEHGDTVAQYHAKDVPLSLPAASDRETNPMPAPMQNGLNGVDIAIVGMAGRMPQSQDLHAFWQNLVEERDLIGEVPADRWDWRAAGGNTATAWGGFMPDIDCFDTLFFGISPIEAEQMDPQHRLFLQASWSALEDAGIRPSDLSDSDTAVYVGVSTAEYQSLLSRVDGHAATGAAHAMLPNRLSFLLNLHGPSEPVDTACSSSLVALHRAVQTIRHGRSRLAIVGGVNAMLTPTLHLALSNAGMLSPDGRCKTFDALANGYVRGEGVVALILKPLDDALADGNPVYAVIKGSATNHGGRSASLTAPDINAQAAVLEAAYRDAGIDPITVSYIETHGTGTPLGDPVEIESLKKAFDTLYRYWGHDAATVPHCGLGTVKSNVGHLESAAGLAGLAKVVLAMKHRTLPASLHCREINPYIKLEQSPFYIVTRTQAWQPREDGQAKGAPLRAGISSFGFGGVNAHVVLEEYVAPAGKSTWLPLPAVVPISARDEQSLKAQVEQLLTAIESGELDEDELPGIACTVQLGREAMEERLAILADSMDDLRAALRRALDGQLLEGKAWRGRVPPGMKPSAAVPVPPSASRCVLEQLLKQWVAGNAIDWSSAYDGTAPRRLRLPTYAFQGQRYWPIPLPNVPIASSISSSRHPLLQQEQDGQHFSCLLSGKESFVADHRVAGQVVLPGVAHLEMAYAAASRTLGRKTICIRQVAWQQPVRISGQPTSLCLSLSAQEVNGMKFRIADGAQAEAKLYSQGWVSPETPEEEAACDVAALRSRCRRRVEVGACYAAFDCMGLQYGPAFRPLQAIFVGEQELIAELALPQAAAQGTDFALHPSLIDGAFQAMIGFALDAGEVPKQAVLPFALEEITVFAPCPEKMLVWVRKARGSATQPDTMRMDIDLLDHSGRVCVRMRDLNVRQAAAPAQSLLPLLPAGEHLLTPAWETVGTEDKYVATRADGRTVIVGGTPVQYERLSALFKDVARLELPRNAGIAETARLLGDDIGHVIWLLPDYATDEAAVPDCAAAQADGLMFGFRMLKSLLEAGYDGKPLHLTAITVCTWGLHDAEPTNPAHAGVGGMLGAVAKEYPAWTVRLFDLGAADAVPEDLPRLAADRWQRPWLWRDGEWHRQVLLPVGKVEDAGSPAYREGGVYVVIGGAGGIGEAWTEHVMRKHRAQVLWVGRRAEDEGIREKQKRLSEFGAAPVYSCADASDCVALTRVRDETIARFGKIDGVVHSAIVLLDKGFAQMSEAEFQAALTAQIDVAVRMAEVFGEVKPDFFLFFSSLQSFMTAAGQSNYAAGCTFKDAFAKWLARVGDVPVKLMNWGYWGSIGVVATDAYRERMARFGIGSIDPQAGMAALHTLVGGAANQAAYVKTLSPLSLPGLSATESATLLGGTPASPAPVADNASPALLSEVDVAALVEKKGAFDAALCRSLWSKLSAIGLFEHAEFDLDGLLARGAILPRFSAWLAHSLYLLGSHGYIEWDGKRGRSVAFNPTADANIPLAATLAGNWQDDADLAAHIKLVTMTLDALHDILQGRSMVTDVMFPNGSMTEVEPIYHGNRQSDHFNHALVEFLVSSIDARLQKDPAANIRLLEIGAGTGGTTVPLLKRLEVHRSRIETYCYTDISRAFLLHAQNSFGAAHAYLDYRLMDVEKPIAPQGLSIGTYDFVIATNVLHATRDIRVTLRNAKALLRKGGRLLINELVDRSVFAHLTFGLLDGWWRKEDACLRLQGSPLLSTDCWQSVLAEEGFEAACFPARTAIGLGQQVISAASDGIVRQRVEQSSAVETKSAATSVAVAAVSKGLRDCCVAYLKRMVSETLKLPVAQINSSEMLGRYGIDSILAMSLTNALRKDFGSDLPSTLLFDFQSVNELADHLLATRQEACKTLLGADAGPASAAPDKAAPQFVKQAPAAAIVRPETRSQVRGGGPLEIAVIGLSGRYAQADNIDEFWEKLVAGLNCISEIPADRWDWKKYYDPVKGKPGRSYTKWGGFVRDIDAFDAAFFHITPRDAEGMDPQERLMLEEAYACIEDAGHVPADLSPRRRVGVFVGVMHGHYPTGAQYWSVANRISYQFDFHGPSLAVDTACSSSLSALHLALDSIVAGSSDCAIVGGVNLVVDPIHYVGLSSLTMLSESDACKAFGAGADGFVDGEGVGAMLLKPLAQAIADGDPIYGVIQGSMINAGGRTNGYTVPNPHAQQAVVSEAIERSGIPARAVSYIEAHGTGTALGDPIEIAGLTRAFRASTEDKGFCRIGSVKSNIGHCESAAGIAGVTKVLLQMKYGQLAPSLHAAEPNPHIDFAQTPFVVQQCAESWQRPTVVVEGRAIEYPRIAGVSSFGAGGANAHVVIEEFIDTRASTPASSLPAMFVLSAQNEDRLRARASRLLKAVGAGQYRDADLTDMAYTLQVGREAMPARWAATAQSLESLTAKLNEFCEGKASGTGFHVSDIRNHTEAMAEFEADPDMTAMIISNCLGGGKYDRLLALWTKGLAVDWRRLYEGVQPRRLRLPTYPFAKQRYWYGKKRSALDAPTYQPAHTEIDEASGNSTLDVVQRAVCQTLGYEKIALDQSFLDMGGDSIRAAQLRVKLQDVLGLEIPFSKVMDASTIVELAQIIDALRETQSVTNAAVTQPVPSGNTQQLELVQPLSLSQEQFFFLDRLNPGNPAFNLPGALRIEGPFDIGRLRQAYAAAIDRHDVLRTRFNVQFGLPTSVVRDAGDLAFKCFDISPKLPRYQLAYAKSILKESAQQPFDLEKGNLSRLTVLILGDEDHIILLNLHHIIGDVSSVAVLLSELVEAGLNPGWKPTPRAQLQYAALAQVEKEVLPAQIERAMPYWLNRLADLPGPIPFDRERPAVPSYKGEIIQFGLDRQAMERINAFCKAKRLSSFVVLLAAFDVLLQRLTDRDDIVVGSPYANRERQETVDMVGCLAYALVLRTSLSGDMDFNEVLNRVKETVYDAFDHLYVPYTRLVEALNPVRHGNANPLYQVMFNVIPMPALPFGVNPVSVDSEFTDYDLFFRLHLGKDSLTGFLQYSSDLFDAGTAQHIAQYYCDLLQFLVDYPDALLANLALPEELMAQKERASSRTPPAAVQVASTFTDRPLADALHYWGQITGLMLDVNFAGYNQVFQTLYDTTTPFHGNRNGLNLVMVRTQDWLRFDGGRSIDRIGLVREQFDELAEALTHAMSRLEVPVLVIVLPSDPAVTGIDLETECALYAEFAACMEGVPRLAIRSWQDVEALYPVEQRFDPMAEAAGHVPFIRPYYAAIASFVARFVSELAEHRMDGIWDRPVDEIHAAIEATRASAAEQQGAKPYAAPESADQGELVVIFEDVLKRSGVGIDDSFFDLGGHSLAAIGMISRINDVFSTKLSVADIFMAPTIRRLALRLRSNDNQAELVDLFQAALLDEDIQPIPNAKPAATPQAIFLTGATGFVGRFLLRELLDKTSARLYCLVRATDEKQGMQRLRKVLKHWQLWKDSDAKRIVAVPGDLAKPRLGIGQEMHARICREVDIIYHNGTSMNHLETFSMARAANVDGVKDLLRIAVTGKPKTFNYVSTLAVFSPHGRTGEHVFDERFPLDGEQHLEANGYTTSKWVGEQLTHLACERGLHCNVLRLGLVTGDTQHGRYDELQSFYRLLKSCALMGAAFEGYRYDLVITPVDYVARALAYLGTKYTAGGGIYHLTSMDITPMDEIFRLYNRFAEQPLRILTHRNWLGEVRAQYESGESLPILPVVQALMALDEQEQIELTKKRAETSLVYDCSSTHAELEAAGIALPKFNADMFCLYMQGMLDMDPALRDSGRMRFKEHIPGKSEHV